MSNDNPSINDLLNKNKGDSAPKIADDKTAKEYEKKMAEIRLKEKEDETKKKAATLGVSYIDLKKFPISPEAISSIPEEQAKELKAICFLNSGEEIRIGALNPADEKIKELAYQLEEKFHGHTAVYLISENSFDIAVKIYATIPKIKKTVKGVEITEETLKKYQEEITSFEILNERLKEATTTDVFAMLIAMALKMNASDIHIEAEEKEIIARLRLDGILQQVASIESSSWREIISRLKLIAGLKINVADKPQDGRFTIFLEGDKVDVRVSTVPTSYGESVVMRLLRSASVGLEFDALGIRGRAFEQIKKEIERPNGMIITTGPTGSGKTTTLYAILKKLISPEVKIITLEDPVEYKLPGINQSQVDYSKDYTFAKGLKSLMRQDPDIIMVGEIRDLDTAEVAIQAALTGHLVISTIHTNSASGAVPRFLSMNVKPFLLAPALNAVVGQRLVRKICDKCKKVEDVLDAEVMTRVKDILGKLPENGEEKKKIDLNNLKFQKGEGCEACNGLGYKGRMGVYEIMIMTPEIQELILSGNSTEYKIEEIALRDGMITMVQDGLLKALDGITTVDEVFRVVE
jgi:type IV pilus assembly protein PilB